MIGRPIVLEIIIAAHARDMNEWPFGRDPGRAVLPSENDMRLETLDLSTENMWCPEIENAAKRCDHGRKPCGP